jgi:hypothetical protein
MLIQRAKRPDNFPVSVPPPKPSTRSLEVLGLELFLGGIRPTHYEDSPITDEEVCQHFGIGHRKYLKLINEVALDCPEMLENIKYYFRSYDIPLPTCGPVARLAAAVKKLKN